DFQDSPDDEDDTRSSHEYLNDLKEEYQARSLLAKSKRFFKKDTQRFNITKATNQTECQKCGKKGHFARGCWSMTSVPSYQSPFQSKSLSSSQHKPELRPTKDFKAKYNKVKANLALLSSSASASKASMVKNKGLIAKAYEWDEEKVSSDDNEMVEVKVLMALAKDNDVVSKKGARNGEWVKISMRKVHTLLEMEDNDDTKTYLVYLCIDLNYVEEQRNNLLSKHRDLVHELNACKEQLLVLKQAKLDFLTMILLVESQRSTIDPSVAVIDSLATDYDLADEFLVCSTPLPALKKLDGAEPISRPKTINSILRLKSTFKCEALKGVIINEPSSAPVKGNKNSSALVVYSTPTGKLKSKEVGWIISLEREINPRNPQHTFKRCEVCGSLTYTTTDHYDIEWFKRGEALQAKKCDIRKPIWYLDSGCSRHMTRVKSYLYKYVEQSRPKVLFRDYSTFTTEGYGSIKCNGIVFTKVAFVNGLKYNLISISQLCDAKYIVQFDEKRGTIFNSNKEVVMIAPRVKYVYVLDMTSSAQESCFFAKASENLNWLWHKDLLI
ncbi:retrovirus-related pol polyprotein from transposon TNT 1-94, partial [Tanacetum coccineum]